MKSNVFPIFLGSIILGVGSPTEEVLASALEIYPLNVSCELSMDSTHSSKSTPIEEVARSCNEFRVENELEYNFVKGACILGGTLSGAIYAFSDRLCQSEKAAALCRVTTQSTKTEEVTWYFEPDSPQNGNPSHKNRFKASCDELNGDFETLRY